jgi:Peptidase A4 family
MYQVGVGRGIAVLVAASCFLACAPAWAGDAGSAVRHGARAGLAHSELMLPLGSLAVSSSPSQAGLVTHVSQARPRAHLSITPGKLAYRGGRVKFSISASHATRCTLSSKPRFFAGPNPQRVKCRGKQTFALPAVSTGLHWSFKFTAVSAQGKSVATRKLVLTKPPFVVSRNWSGYVVPSSTLVTAVSGRFTVPKLNCTHTPTAGESIWVGIGGSSASAGDLLQTGVRSDCIGGAQDNNPGWWEEFPQLPETDFSTMTVSAGDVIQATVAKNPDGSWTTRLDDVTKGVSGVMTTGDGYGTMLDSNWGVWATEEGTTATIAYTGGYSAEWIAEDFLLGNGSFVPLADFGKVAFSSLTTSLPSWALTKGEQVGLGAGPLLLAAPSGPDSSGRGFSVAFTG